MNDSEMMELTEEVMSDHDYQNVNIRVVDLWILLCACQFMSVSRRIHEPLQNGYRDLGKRLEAVIVTIHPNVKPLITAGWQADTVDNLPMGGNPITLPWLHDDDLGPDYDYLDDDPI